MKGDMTMNHMVMQDDINATVIAPVRAGGRNLESGTANPVNNLAS